MSVLNDIKENLTTVRKLKNKFGIQILTTLYGEAAMKGKNNGNRESTDDEVVATVRKFIKNAKELLGYTTCTISRGQIKAEIIIYEQYLPTQLTIQELSDIITKIITDNDIAIPKGMGRVMKELSAQYAGRYDGKLASELVRSHS